MEKIGKELSEASMLRSAMDSAAIEGNTLSYRQTAAISRREYMAYSEKKWARHSRAV